MQPDGGEMGIAFQQLRDLIRKRVQQAGPARALFFRRAGATPLVCCQYPGHTLTRNACQQSSENVVF
jgi:hypothetical protein